MGFTALGALAAVLVSMAPVQEAWEVAGGDLFLSLLSLAGTVVVIMFARRAVPPGLRPYVVVLLLIPGYFLTTHFFLPATERIEAIDPALTGYLGGLGLPVLLAWPVGGLVAAGAG